MFKNEKTEQSDQNDLPRSKKPMHESMVRLYEAALVMRGLSKMSRVGEALDATPQTMKHWEKRGISREGMLLAQQHLGISATWLADGTGEMRFSHALDGREPHSIHPDQLIQGAIDLMEQQDEKGREIALLGAKIAIALASKK